MGMSMREWHNLSLEEREQLFKVYPDRFEKMNETLVAEVISRAKKGRREKLKRLQWRIQAERRRHHSELGAAVALYNMFESYVYGAGALEELHARYAQLHRLLVGDRL